MTHPTRSIRPGRVDPTRTLPPDNTTPIRLHHRQPTGAFPTNVDSVQQGNVAGGERFEVSGRQPDYSRLDCGYRTRPTRGDEISGRAGSTCAVGEAPMRMIRIILAVAAVLSLSQTARAGIITFTDLDAFLEAAGDVHEIDFETLPDGTPSVPGTQITPDFNYTHLGVTFLSPYPTLDIAYANHGEHLLTADHWDSSARNWMIAEFVPPASAIGIIFPGGTTLSTYDVHGELITSISGGGSGWDWFLGVISDVPIATGIGDRGGSGEVWQSFLFTPVPEPASVALLGMGAIMFVCRRCTLWVQRISR